MSKYIITLEVKEEGGGRIERKFSINDDECHEDFLDPQGLDMMDTLRKAKEVKF